MILPSFVIPELINKQCSETGVDSYDHCFDKNHYKSYPYSIEYKYNDRGYRDKPWPNNLQDCIWCVGDSFTVGLGTPYENTWTQILEKVSGKPVVNVSMDGASNHWISRKVVEVCKTIQPKNIVIMWSYAHRRESTIESNTDLERRQHYLKDGTELDDLLTFKTCVNNTARKSNGRNLIHLTIPNAATDTIVKEVFKNVGNFLGSVEILDYARDSWHFDIKTSKQIVNQITPFLIT